MDFWDAMWLMLSAFVFIAYLMVLFNIVVDLFRDRDTSGWAKAAWMICLVFFPFITAFVYLVARGRGMSDRAGREAEALKAQQDAYIREVAGQATPADQVAKAKAMLDAGAINDAEYEQLKHRALVG